VAKTDIDRKTILMNYLEECKLDLELFDADAFLYVLDSTEFVCPLLFNARCKEYEPISNLECWCNCEDCKNFVTKAYPWHCKKGHDFVKYRNFVRWLKRT